MPEAPWMAVLVRWATFAALLAAIGAAAFRFVVLRRLSHHQSSADSLGSTEHRAAGLGLAATLALVPLAAARLIIQAGELRDPGEPWSVPVGIVLSGTTWGIGWWLQLGASALGAAGFGAARLGRRAGWAAAAAGVVALAATPALSGHAIGSPRLPVLAVAADTLHVLGAGVWLGALLVIAATLLRSSSRAAPAAIRIFSPMALTGAGMVVASGVVAGWLHLGSLPALWGTDYGRVLLGKLALFGLVALTGAYNWRRVLPGLDGHDGVARLRVSARAELLLALLLLLVTAILVATPLPGEE